MKDEALQQQFARALDALVEQVKEDQSILAAILCGSLSYDAVWANSDIDLALVTIDDRAAESSGKALYADGVNVHAFLLQRAAFRRIVEGSLANSFMHSLLAKGKLLYTHDPTIEELFARLAMIGDRDTELQLFRAAMEALPLLYKAHKFFVTRGDLEYTALWILYAATPLARIEIYSARRLADREVIPQALALNPALFKTIYTDLLNAKKTRRAVQTALDAIDQAIAARAPALFAPLLDHLREAGEARSCTDIDDHFRRNFNLDGVVTACEYLADQGLLGKAGIPARLTKRSSIEVQELAFFSLQQATMDPQEKRNRRK